jgi:hypothetical protein
MQSANFSKLMNITSNTRVMAFVEVNYTSDGPKIMTVDAISTNYSTNYSQKYIESFTKEGVSIENYTRVKRNNSVYAISFDIINHWHNQTVYWNISNPFSSNNSVIANNQSVHVYQENSYSQGTNKVEISARVSTFVDKMTDIFEVRPLQIYDFQTLKETLTSSVFEIMVQNNLNTTQQFNWTLNTGYRNISNLANVTGYTFVFVETNYSATGVYKTRAYVNKSTYNDTQNGVTVI